MVTARRTGQGVFRQRLLTPLRFLELPGILGYLNEDLTDFSKAFSELRRILMDATSDNVASKGGTLGGAWEQTYKGSRYPRRKAMEGKGRVDLWVTGRLLGQLSSLSGGKSKVTKSSLKWGTKGLSYAAAVNFGTTLTDNRIARREFFGLSDAREAESQNLFLKHMESKIQKAQAALDRASGDPVER